jgi:hypothetical protein
MIPLILTLAVAAIGSVGKSEMREVATHNVEVRRELAARFKSCELGRVAIGSREDALARTLGQPQEVDIAPSEIETERRRYDLRGAQLFVTLRNRKVATVAVYFPRENDQESAADRNGVVSGLSGESTPADVEAALGKPISERCMEGVGPGGCDAYRESFFRSRNCCLMVEFNSRADVNEGVSLRLSGAVLFSKKRGDAEVIMSRGDMDICLDEDGEREVKTNAP